MAITAIGQKVQPGNVLSIWEVEFTLEEGMTFEQLEEFYVKTYKPAIEKNFPGVHFFFMKGERGERTGKYVQFVVFDSIEERNKWYPASGEASELAKKAADNMRKIQDRLGKMVSGATWTDYVVL